jgi:hypothetical protein
MHSTPWKKSRTYGDIYGGRKRLRLNDNIFARAHSLKRPSKGAHVPILMEDNPSRDFYYPLSMDEVVAVLGELPKRHTDYLTHVWLRRQHEENPERNGQVFGTYITGSGVSVITLYAWPTSNQINFGGHKPRGGMVKEIEKFGGEVIQKKGVWFGQWDKDSARKYTRFVLLHEVGHHIDPKLWLRNRKSLEDFADQYGYEKSVLGSRVVRDSE